MADAMPRVIGAKETMMPEKVSTSFQTLMWSWTEWKLFLERSVSFSQDAVHVIVGVLLMLAAALLLRQPISSFWPWFVVLVSTFINEFIDLWAERWPEASMQYGEGLKDVLMTMLLPTVLLVTSRIFPWVFKSERRSGRRG